MGRIGSRNPSFSFGRGNLPDQGIRSTGSHRRQTSDRCKNDRGEPVAFMGTEQSRLEMLFLSASERGKGIGTRLLQYGVQNYGIREVTVNEQNPQAVGFYEHFGFQTYKRTDLDEQGDPYPLLYMKLT